MRYVYQVRLDPDEGTILVTCPDVPMVATEGETEPQALANAADALGTALRHLVKAGAPLPVPATPAGPGLHSVALAVDDAMKLAVIEAFRASGLSKTELARRLGKGETEARRILDPDHATKLPMIEAALAALGRRAVVEVAEAA